MKPQHDREWIRERDSLITIAYSCAAAIASMLIWYMANVKGWLQ